MNETRPITEQEVRDREAARVAREDRAVIRDLGRRISGGETVSTAPVFRPNRAERRQMARDARRMRARAGVKA